MIRNRLAALLTSSIAFSVPAVAEPSLTYYTMNGATITDLGTLGGSESWGNDINNSGVIVGAAMDESETRRAFRYNGNMIDISIGAFTMSSAANGINGLGRIVGTFEFPSIPGPGQPPSFAQPHAFYWKSGAPLLQLDALTNDPDWQTGAIAINGGGVIVGSAYESVWVDDYDGSCSGLLPVSWPSYSAAPQVLTCVYGYPNDINDAGSVVGSSVSGIPKMFRIVAGVLSALPQQPGIQGLSKLSFGPGEAINASNHVVGQHYYSQQISSTHSVTRTRAFYWNGTAATTTLIGVLPGGRTSTANDINKQRMVVGNSETNPSGIAYFSRAYIWHPDFGMKVLPSLPSSPELITPGNCVAKALNDRNATDDLVQATGWCMVDGKRRAVRWDISVDYVVTTSETSSFVMP